MRRTTQKPCGHSKQSNATSSGSVPKWKSKTKSSRASNFTKLQVQILLDAARAGHAQRCHTHVGVYRSMKYSASYSHIKVTRRALCTSFPRTLCQHGSPLGLFPPDLFTGLPNRSGDLAGPDLGTHRGGWVTTWCIVLSLGHRLVLQELSGG